MQLLSTQNSHCSLRHMRLHMHTQAHMQVSLCMQYITHVKSKYFHFLFCYYISHIKFFIEGFFIEDYIQEI